MLNNTPRILSNSNIHSTQEIFDFIDKECKTKDEQEDANGAYRSPRM